MWKILFWKNSKVVLSLSLSLSFYVFKNVKNWTIFTIIFMIEKNNKIPFFTIEYFFIKCLLIIILMLLPISPPKQQIKKEARNKIYYTFLFCSLVWLIVNELLHYTPIHLHVWGGGIGFYILILVFWFGCFCESETKKRKKQKEEISRKRRKTPAFFCCGKQNRRKISSSEHLEFWTFPLPSHRATDFCYEIQSLFTSTFEIRATPLFTSKTNNNKICVRKFFEIARSCFCCCW